MFVSVPPCLGLCCKDLEARRASVARVWNHLQVHTLMFLLLGQEELETRTANPSDYTWPLLVAWLGDTGSKPYVFREQGRSCTSSELVVEVTAFCLLQVSHKLAQIQRERAQASPHC